MGIVLVLLPPGSEKFKVPPKFMATPQLAALQTSIDSALPGYTLRAIRARHLLPTLPPQLHYSSVQGMVLAIATHAPPYSGPALAPTMLGYPASYNTAAIASSFTSLPAGFSAPSLPPNYTCTGLAPGAAIPAVPAGYMFAQLQPGVLVVLANGDEWLLTARTQPSAAPVQPAAPAPAAIPSVLSLSSVDLSALPSVPSGLQIILLPANAVIPGLPASSPIPASFQVPAALQTYNYVLEATGTALPTLPAGYTAVTPVSGQLPLLSLACFAVGICLQLCLPDAAN
jgi:hypothetical protein